MTAVTRKQINLRCSEEDRAEIQRRADAAGLTLSSYMLAAALGRLSDPAQLDRIEAALERIERAVDRRR
jgi:uncharacterized protein (DUF1778 family)